MKPLTVFAPAKVNLFLAITGRREDGFHDLVSVVAPLEFGDDLKVTPQASGAYRLHCDAPEVPTDETNLVLRAARLFSEASQWEGSAAFELIKRTPTGAGLGGGSSNGTAALLALNDLAGRPLNRGQLRTLAAQLGSDCVLFLEQRACVMRGRGDRVAPLTEAAAARLSGRRLLLFKPSFGIPTAWAYREMAAAAPSVYLAPDAAEQTLENWIRSSPGPAEELVFNNMETVAFAKYLALPTLLDTLRQEFGVTAGMSGSGSACYCLLTEGTPVSAIASCIQCAWGSDAFIMETRIA